MFANDRSLKIALWIIALSLAVIALRPMVDIKDVQAQSQLSGSVALGRIVPFASQGGGAFWAYDRETLAIYVYDAKDGQGYYLGKLSQLGKPMDQTGVKTIPFLR
jgi:hypothetical protein